MSTHVIHWCSHLLFAFFTMSVDRKEIDFDFTSPVCRQEAVNQLRLAEQYLNMAQQKSAYDEIKRDTSQDLYKDCLTTCVKMLNVRLLNEFLNDIGSTNCFIILGNTYISRIFQFNQTIPLELKQVPTLLRAACLADMSTGKIVLDIVRNMFRWKHIWNCLKDHNNDVPCNALLKFYLITGQVEFFNLYYMAIWADIYCGGRRVYEIANQSEIILAPFLRYSSMC
ncbi:hypothetical protein ACOME3_008133 [Neoechinorhynchus agilis]